MKNKTVVGELELIIRQKGAKKVQSELDKLRAAAEKSKKTNGNYAKSLYSATAAATRTKAKLDKLRATVEKNKKANDNFANSLSSSYVAMGKAAAVIASFYAAFRAGKFVVDNITQLELYNAQLKTLTGSTAQTQAYLSIISEFAATTPFQLGQVVDGFVKLNNLGLAPTERKMRAFGNISAAMGKDFNQIIEAVADATTNEFERLKEFGIKTRQEADKVTFTFQGVETQVDKSAQSIEQYLVNIGEEKFTTAMSDRMETLSAAIDQTKDNFSLYVAQMSRATGVGGALRKILGTINEKLSDQAEHLRILNNYEEYLGNKESQRLLKERAELTTRKNKLTKLEQQRLTDINKIFRDKHADRNKALAKSLVKEIRILEVKKDANQTSKEELKLLADKNKQLSQLRSAYRSTSFGGYTLRDFSRIEKAMQSYVNNLDKKHNGESRTTLPGLAFGTVSTGLLENKRTLRQLKKKREALIYDIQQRQKAEIELEQQAAEKKKDNAIKTTNKVTLAIEKALQTRRTRLIAKYRENAKVLSEAMTAATSPANIAKHKKLLEKLTTTHQQELAKLPDAARDTINQATHQLDALIAKQQTPIQALALSQQAALVAFQAQLDKGVVGFTEQRLNKLKNIHNKQREALQRQVAAAAAEKKLKEKQKEEDRKNNEVSAAQSSLDNARAALLTGTKKLTYERNRTLAEIRRNAAITGGDVSDIVAGVNRQYRTDLVEAKTAVTDFFREIERSSNPHGYFDFNAEKQNLADEYQRKLEQLREFKEQGLITEEEFAEKKFQINKNYADKLKKAERIKNEQQLTLTADLFRNMAQVAKVFGEKGFKTFKALSIAEATINTFKAATNAYATVHFPFNIAAAAAITAAGVAQVQQIRSQNYSGAYEHGGMIPAGNYGLVGEAGPELVQGPAVVTSARTTAAHSSTNGSNVIINNYGPPVAAEIQQQAGGDLLVTLKPLLERNNQAVIGTIAGGIASGGSTIARAMESTYSLNRV